MKIRVSPASLLLILTLLPHSAIAQWFPVPVPVGVNMLLGMDFHGLCGTGGGWTVSTDFQGRGIYSTDGGTTWYPARLPDSTRALIAMALLDSTRGFCAGASNVTPARAHVQSPSAGDAEIPLPRGVREFAQRLGIRNGPGTRGYFLTTTDGGRSWSPVGSFPDSITYLTGMEFVNDHRGYVSAALGPGVTRAGMLRTTDGGITWTNLPVPADIVSLRNPAFADSLTGIVPGYAVRNSEVLSVLLRTTDGGDHWSSTTVAAVDNFTGVAFTGPTTAFATGPQRNRFAPMVLKTTNAGANWNPLPFSPDSVMLEGLITMRGKETVVGVGTSFLSTPSGSWNPFVVRTTDGGLTWVPGIITGGQPGALLYSGSMISENEGFVCGGGFNLPALLLHTTNGGVTWVERDGEKAPAEIRLLQNYPNPFNSATTIIVVVPGDAGRPEQSPHATLRVFDLLGRERATLVDEPMSPGTHTVPFDASHLASGVYFYRFTVWSRSVARAMTLLR